VIKYKAWQLNKSHIMWHQLHVTMGWHTYEMEEWVFSLSKNALPETASRFREVCCLSGTSPQTSQNE
jgi:hypothetical protein